MLKGLILKDIYSVKFQILGGVALMFLPNVLMMLGGGGMAEDDFGGFGSVIVYGLLNYITITMCSSFMLNTLEFDEKSGWAKMQRTMPVTEGQIIAGKYLAMGAVLGILTGLSLLCNLFGVIVFEAAAEPLISLPAIMALLQLITLSVCFVLGYRFGSKVTLILYIGVELVVLVGAFLVIVGFIKENISAVALRIIAYGGLPALTSVVIAVCYNSGKKAVERDI